MRNERNLSGLERKVVEFDFAETWRRRRMNDGASSLGSNGNFEGEITNGETDERTRIHSKRVEKKNRSVIY